MLFRDYVGDRFPKKTTLGGSLEIVLRPLEPRDQPALLDFFRAVPEADRLFLADDVTDSKLIEAWCRKLDLDTVFPLMAMAGERIIGNATLHRSKGGWMSHIGRVRVVVHPEFRGRGIARALLDELIEIATDIGLDKLDAEFMSGQEQQQRVFEKMGFVRIAELPDHVLDRRNEAHNLIIMAYDLKGETYAVD